MKRIGISISVFFLAVLILLGSGKYTIGKMICVGNGQATYSLGNAKDCCDKNGARHETLKRSCCDLINVSYSLDDYNPSQKITVSPLQFDCLYLPTAGCHLLSTVVFSTNIFSVSALPPPDTKGRIYSICSLLL